MAHTSSSSGDHDFGDADVQLPDGGAATSKTPQAAHNIPMLKIGSFGGGIGLGGTPDRESEPGSGVSFERRSTPHSVEHSIEVLSPPGDRSASNDNVDDNEILESLESVTSVASVASKKSEASEKSEKSQEPVVAVESEAARIARERRERMAAQEAEWRAQAEAAAEAEKAEEAAAAEAQKSEEESGKDQGR